MTITSRDKLASAPSGAWTTSVSRINFAPTHDDTFLDWEHIDVVTHSFFSVLFPDVRTPTYLRLDMSGTNVILNSNDASEYLKIGADGLSARSGQ